MVKTSTIVAAFAACTFASSACAHQESMRRALSTDQRKPFAQNTQAELASCTKSEASRKLQERAVARRAEAVENLRQQRRQRRLDAMVVEPELTEGPYYVLGEYIRNDMRQEQKGIPMYMDIQVIDVSTCNPVKDMYVDLWHCNATGVYSGDVASGNGDNTDTSNADATFLRSVTPTDEDGVAQITSIFPGSYTGRTTHVHTKMALFWRTRPTRVVLSSTLVNSSSTRVLLTL
ncbi:unnamed protein product [Phytophthora lilii]|uniref:Unnamed protein product n=1 Tax=Phytophthora lilii TaxID=2077276 RepID=A0A9W6U8E0_9STRA|nr:unnamed protein product [Phytophthora lilii]